MGLHFSTRPGALSFGSVLVLAGALGGCSDSDDSSSNGPATTTAQALTQAGFTDLLAALQQAGLTAEIDGAPAVTVLAPSNDALAASLPGGGTFDTLTAAEREAFLRNHVLTVELLGEDLGSAGAVATLGGGTVLLDRIAGRDHANDQPIEVLDQLLSNGVVHGLDGVLTPAGATLQATLIERGATTFLALAQALGLDDLLLDPASQATLLVPTDAAFEAALADPASAPLFLPENVALLEEVLLYHLISVQERRLVGDVVAEGVVLGHGGEAVLFTEDQTSARANAARIVSPNLPAADGVVHLIDRVLGANDVVAELLAKDLASLAAAVVASDFAATLSDSAAPVTFFAPDDGAFAQLDAELLEQLSAGGPIGELPELLAYHTLAGEVTATELLLGDDPDTLTGEPLLIDRLGSTTLVNDARLVDADQLLTNGLVHTVDRVLTRPLDVFATLEARGLTTVRDALVQAGGKNVFDGSQAQKRTLFAPSEEAFAALPAGFLDCLSEPLNAARLEALLLNHSLKGSFKAGTALDVRMPASDQGAVLDFTLGAGDTLLVDGVTVSSTNVACTNGVLHVIDEVLLEALELQSIPATLPLISDQYVALQQALQQTGLGAELEGEGPFTFFAPTAVALNDLAVDLGMSFPELLGSDLLPPILRYHVIEGVALSSSVIATETSLTTLQGEDIAVDGLELNGVPLGFGDQLASNGVVHMIEVALVPPSLMDQLQTAATLAAAKEPTGVAPVAPSAEPLAFTFGGPLDAPPSAAAGLRADGYARARTAGAGAGQPGSDGSLATWWVAIDPSTAVVGPRELDFPVGGLRTLYVGLVVPGDDFAPQALSARISAGLAVGPLPSPAVGAVVRYDDGHGQWLRLDLPVGSERLALQFPLLSTPGAVFALQLAAEQAPPGAVFPAGR